MPFEIVLSPLADSQFRKLERQVQERFSGVFERIKTRPESFLTRLVGSAYCRLRVGAYRAIVRLEHAERVIYVVKIGKRENIYD